jgi:YesN/AraC family two-component response regulator
MPLMNGRELAEKMFQFLPDIKILYMSGYTANVIAHKGILDEGLNFINKPFSKQDISVKLRKIFDENS